MCALSHNLFQLQQWAFLAGNTPPFPQIFRREILDSLDLLTHIQMDHPRSTGPGSQHASR